MGPHLRVIDPGFFTTVQDLGRAGLADMGVPIGGAADALALRLANRAVGNSPGDAGLEMTLIGAVLEFHADATIAIAGAACEAVIESAGRGARAVVACMPERVLRGEVLRVGPLRSGVRAYVGIAGGIDVEPVLGSRATHVAAGFGGFQGRALKREDRVPIREVARVRSDGLAAEIRRLARETAERRVLRAVDGAHAARFGAAARDAFWFGVFAVTPQCDRMGVRLSGTRVDTPEGGRMTSEGMMWGAVQVPESGEPIILMCDHPTTGGYPVIAAVAAVDLPVLGQLRPGDSVRFERVDQATALGLLRERERELDAMVVPIGGSGPVIDLNCDLGESEEPAQLAADSGLLRVVTSANIACGGHAGDERSMERTVRECVARGVAIGAHPSYPDRKNFGRVEVAMTPEEIERVVGEQVRALGVVAARCGGRVAHVKPHGALYHAAMKREEVARAIGRAVLAIDASLVMVGQAGGAGLAVWRAMGLGVAGEAFADRVYEVNGSLRSRALPGALIEKPAAAGEQAVRIATGGEGRGGHRGGYAPSRCETICVHGDTPGAVEVARAVRAGLETAGVRMCAIARA